MKWIKSLETWITSTSPIKIWKSYHILLGLKHTQTNSNIGLRGKKPKFFLFPSKLSAQDPNPKEERVDFVCDTSPLPKGFPCNISHTSMQVSLQRSLLLSPSLTLGRNTHTHTPKISQTLSRTLKNTSSLSTQRSRNLGSFQEDPSTNSSSKVRLCLDLWLRFFVLPKSFPNPCQNRDLTS